MSALRLAQQLLNQLTEGPNQVVGDSQKAVFLELRQKRLAMGCVVRCYPDFHLFDTEKLVLKRRTGTRFRASKHGCQNSARGTGSY